MSSTLVLGGGLSGLSAAYYLSKKLPQKVVLLEGSNRLGGWIKSEKVSDSVTFEQGPRTIRPRGIPGQNTLQLIEELKLSDQILSIPLSHHAAKNRMICVNGKLCKLPSSVFSLLKTQPPFSKPLILHLARDIFAAKKNVADESIYDFISRRFGMEVADYLISPLICGICAGDAKKVSVKFLMKPLFEYEQQHGSISKGVLKELLSRQKKTAPNTCSLALKAKKERWAVYSFVGGMEMLPKALENNLKQDSKVEIRLNQKCNSLEICHNRVSAHIENKSSIVSSHIISSVPAETLASLVHSQHPVLAGLLKQINNVTVGVVNLQFKGRLIKDEGFGFLVPSKEKLPILGVIYDSCCFPTQNNTVLTVMMGGNWFEELFGQNPDEKQLLTIALDQIRDILGISEKPEQYKVNILEKCIPQYLIGHDDVVKEVNQYINKNNLPISICGASYYGVGVNDVILSAKTCVDKLSR